MRRMANRSQRAKGIEHVLPLHLQSQRIEDRPQRRGELLLGRLVPALDATAVRLPAASSV